MAYSDHPAFSGLNGENPADLFADLPTPCYIIDQAQLEKNAALLAGVAERTGCRILLAQKAFSNFAFYPLLARYLAGTEASGLFEARLGAEEMPGREVHVFSAAYRAFDYTSAERYLHQLMRVYPGAAEPLYYQAEFPDGIFARVNVVPGSQDELILAISEATPLLQEGIDNIMGYQWPPTKAGE